jgi:hypothetical protein
LSPVNLTDSVSSDVVLPVVADKTSEVDKPEGGNKTTDESPVKECNSAEENNEKKKKTRGSALMEELLWSGKRRSARVRSSMRRDQEPIDVAEALKRILPRKLL